MHEGDVIIYTEVIFSFSVAFYCFIFNFFCLASFFLYSPPIPNLLRSLPIPHIVGEPKLTTLYVSSCVFLCAYMIIGKSMVHIYSYMCSFNHI